MMTETQMQEILQNIREQLTGNLSEDILLIQKTAEEYEKAGEKEVPGKLLDLAMSLMPEDKLEYLKKTSYIGANPLSAVYREAAGMMQKGEYAEALKLTEQLYAKITENFMETPERRFFSFRNLLESNLYYRLYNPAKRLEKTPFDFPLFLTAHAFCLVELRRPQEAIPVLETAIRFNPLNPDPRFELAEIYKVLRDDEKLLATIRETLPVCITPAALARCYTNLGFYCVNIKDYDSAAHFYLESLVYHDEPMVAQELRHITFLSGKGIQRPTRADILSSFQKHDVMHGANPEVITIASALADQAMEQKEWMPASYYLRVVRDLTGDEHAAAMLEKCQNELEQPNRPHNG